MKRGTCEALHKLTQPRNDRTTQELALRTTPDSWITRMCDDRRLHWLGRFARSAAFGSGRFGKPTLSRKTIARWDVTDVSLVSTPSSGRPFRESYRPRDEWKARVAELLRGDAWIMDGNYGGTLPERVVAADTVILLDLPRIQCIRRVIMRSIRYRGRTRADLNPECAEQLPDWAFLRYIWSYLGLSCARSRVLTRELQPQRLLGVRRAIGIGSRRESSPTSLPHHRTCGSASGGSVS